MLDFNPYRKWLGIPIEEQPPNHYRLLGLELYEQDPEVIEASYNRQSAYIKTFATGKNSTISQRILNELAQAKICLLNKESKKKYDRMQQIIQERKNIEKENYKKYTAQPISRRPKEDKIEEKNYNWFFIKCGIAAPIILVGFLFLLSTINKISEIAKEYLNRRPTIIVNTPPQKETIPEKPIINVQVQPPQISPIIQVEQKPETIIPPVPAIEPESVEELPMIVMNEVELKKHQVKKALEYDVPVHFENSINMGFSFIPPGRFMMGTTTKQMEKIRENIVKNQLEKYIDIKQLEKLEMPIHEVEISKPFYMCLYETTNLDFDTFVKETRYKTYIEKNDLKGWGLTKNKWKQSVKYNWRRMEQYRVSGDYPVVNVNWYDAQEFCKWLSKKEGKVYRLPTDAEWEYACRAGTDTLWYFGDDLNDSKNILNYAWSEHVETQYIMPVGQKLSNSFGLYDMCSNIDEFCQDSIKYYSIDDLLDVDPIGDLNSLFCSCRGGHLYTNKITSRSATRYNFHKTDVGYCWGFRIVREIKN